MLHSEGNAKCRKPSIDDRPAFVREPLLYARHGVSTLGLFLTAYIHDDHLL